MSLKVFYLENICINLENNVLDANLKVLEEEKSTTINELSKFFITSL